MLPETIETELQIPEAERRKVIRLMRRVSRRSYLRQLINRTGDISYPIAETMPQLCALLNGTKKARWRERLLAAFVLRYIPIEKEAIEEVAQVLSKMLQTKSVRRIAIGGFRAVLCLMIAILAMSAGAVS